MTSSGPARERALVVGAAIVDSLAAPSLLLAARRTRPVELSGLWELPGGKVEPGETPHQALHRELGEELAVTIRIGRPVDGPDDGAWPISPRYVMRVWLAEITAGSPVPDGSHDAVRWLPPSQWDDVPWVAADAPILAVLGRTAGFQV